MTVNPEGDLTNHPRLDCFAVPACSLGQGPMNILPIVRGSGSKMDF